MINNIQNTQGILKIQEMYAIFINVQSGNVRFIILVGKSSFFVLLVGKGSSWEKCCIGKHSIVPIQLERQKELVRKKELERKKEVDCLERKKRSIYGD